METLTQTKNNVQIVQQAYTDFGSGNIEGILNACTDDVVWISQQNPNVPFAGTFNGKEGVGSFFSGVAEIDYSNFEPKEFLSDKDAVVVLGHHAGKVKKTGKPFDHDWCMVFKLRDGKVYNYNLFLDTREQAEAFK